MTADELVCVAIGLTSDDDVIVSVMVLISEGSLGAIAVDISLVEVVGKIISDETVVRELISVIED